jgi:hypothetical protein
MNEKPDVQCYSGIMSIKKRRRDALLLAIDAADSAELERAAELIKAAWRGKSSVIPRPRRYASLFEDPV